MRQKEKGHGTTKKEDSFSEIDRKIQGQDVSDGGRFKLWGMGWRSRCVLEEKHVCFSRSSALCVVEGHFLTSMQY